MVASRIHGKGVGGGGGVLGTRRKPCCCSPAACANTRTNSHRSAAGRGVVHHATRNLERRIWGQEGRGACRYRGERESSSSSLQERRENTAVPSRGLVRGNASAVSNLSYSKASIGLTASTVIVAGVANRVSNKIALGFLKDYTLVLIQIQALAYVVVYFSILAVRVKRGLVTKKMLEYPKWKFVAIGFMEACGLALSFPAAARLPGAMLPVLAQIVIPLSLVLSKLILKRKYQLHQLAGCVLVLAGVFLSMKPYLSSSLVSAHLGWYALMYGSSYLFPAIATILKEYILQNREFGDEGMDLFVINSFSSLAQGLVVLGMILFFSFGLSGHIGMTRSYVEEGVRCFAKNYQFPLLYIFCNIFFNVQILTLLKKSNAVLASLSVAFIVPLTFIAFAFPLPMYVLDSSTVGLRLQQVPFYTESIKGLCLLTTGIILYSIKR